MAAKATQSNTRNMTKPFSSFACFQELPVELRVKIWNHSLVERDVDVSVKVDLYKPIDAPVIRVFRYNSVTPPPSILHACRESRCEGLTLYKLAFGTKFIFHDIGPSTTISTTINNEPKIYVKLELDRLWLRNADCTYHEPWIHFFASGVKRVALLAGLKPGSVEKIAPPPDVWLYWPLEDVLLYDTVMMPNFERRDLEGRRVPPTYRTMDLTANENCFNNAQADMRAIHTCHNLWKSKRYMQQHSLARSSRARMLRIAGLFDDELLKSFERVIEVEEWKRPLVTIIEMGV